MTVFSGDHTYNGDDTDGARTFSEGEGDTSRATDPDSSALSPTKKVVSFTKCLVLFIIISSEA